MTASESGAAPRRKVIVTRRERRHDGFLKLDAISFRRTAIQRDGDGYGMIASPEPHEIMECGDSVAVLAHDPERDLVFLAEQFRIATFDHGALWTSETAPGDAADQIGQGWLREIVAGAIPTDETPAAAARRELAEEIGYNAGDLELIGRFYVSPGRSSERIFLYYAAVSDVDRIDSFSFGAAGEDEDILRVEVSSATFLTALSDGLIEDAKTLVAAQWFALHKTAQATIRTAEGD